MRAMMCVIMLAVSLTGASLASAQDCPNCHPHFFGHGKHLHAAHYYKTGDYARYGKYGLGYPHGVHGPYGGPGDCVYRHYGVGDLFRQYYVGNNCGGVGAAMYPAPISTIPPHVGHVYYTYEPLYPHEFLYPHQRTYHRYYNDGRGLTRTKVTWLW